MQKRPGNAKSAGRKKGQKKKAPSRRHPAPELSPMEQLQASIDASIEERRRNPPKTDFVFENGRMKSVPTKLLATEKDVLGMYKHLREFCASSVAPYDFIFKEHRHPIDCLTYMYFMGCIGLEEMRAVLQIPLQIRLLHEYLYRREYLEIFPQRQFVVEYVELLKFMLRLHGLPAPKTVRRYCYSWNTLTPEPADLPYAEDVIATSYEQGLAQNKKFLDEWKEMRALVPISKWAYTGFQDWFVAFNSSNDFDPEMSRVAEVGWILPDGESKVFTEYKRPSDLKSALRIFCQRWALSHLGTPLADGYAAGQVILKADRVEVIPMREDDCPIPNVVAPIGYDVRIPKYYAFSHIQEYYDKDFSQLKYAMKLAGNQRKAKTEIPKAHQIFLLRNLKALLKKYGIPLAEIFLIQKRISGLSIPTLGKYGFKMPHMPIDRLIKGRLVEMNIEDVFEAILKATANSSDEQRSIFRLMAQFGINVDFHLYNAECNRMRT